jgi:hypothetical protein
MEGNHAPDLVGDLLTRGKPPAAEDLSDSHSKFETKEDKGYLFKEWEDDDHTLGCGFPIIE